VTDEQPGGEHASVEPEAGSARREAGAESSQPGVEGGGRRENPGFPRPLTVGTAGHIDHGKTWLVRALTGKDTDRLPEERARGISIDLGYAPLSLADGRQLSVVDVPGHERFVRTMVAGATGVDLFLLVVDAGEGARPQTHEHLAILRLLGVGHGVVAVTKADAVDAERLELAVAEAGELVPGAEVVAVSAKTGAGLEELRGALTRAAGQVEHAHADRPARLWIDRSFTLRGIGTVVTGTLWSGSVGAGDQLRLEPAGRDVRVRSVQVHDEDVSRAEPGQRVAVSLPGVERREVQRGDALVAPGAYPVSYRLDVELDELEAIADGARVQALLGTAHTTAKVVRAGERFAQLRLAEPVVAARGDRVILRGETTLGGARILDPAPARHRDAARFEALDRGEVSVHAPVRVDALRHVLDREPENVERAGPWVFSQAWLDELAGDLRARIAAADPIDPGVAPPSEPWAADVLPLLPFELRGAKLYEPGATASLGAREQEAAALEREVAEAGMRATRVADGELARFLEARGALVRLGAEHAISRGAYERAKEALVAECSAAGDIALARFRDLVGTGRRDAQLLLERFDRDGLTRRVGDRRVLRRAVTSRPSA
jgi:selenocysteine-specific elongation factor